MVEWKKRPRRGIASNSARISAIFGALKPLRVLATLVCCFVAQSAELLKWAPFVEPDFPFFSSTLAARKAAPDCPTNNLTPRGLILNVGGDVHVCFDVDLLRIAAVWKGPGVTPVSMAQGSYENENWGKKAPEGQGLLPKIMGEPLLLNSLLSGCGGEKPLPSDPRPAGPDPDEIGRGPLPAEFGEFKAVNFGTNGLELEYTWRGTNLRQRFTVTNSTLYSERGESREAIATVKGLTALAPKPGKRWPDVVRTKVERISTNDAYRIEHIGLPMENRWRRNVRLADIAFFSDGRAAGVTFDGDVWIIAGLQGDLREVTWRRFTSGLHEP